MSSNVISFGKYKGEAIDQVAAKDPQYIEWLMQQSWFHQKDEAKVVINNYNIEPKETPEHNAMQVRFLDDRFRLGVGSVVNGRGITKLRELTDLGRKAAVLYMRGFKAESEIPSEYPRKWDYNHYHKDGYKLDTIGMTAARHALEATANNFALDFLEGRTKKIYKYFELVRSAEDPIFEVGTDVQFRYHSRWPIGMTYEHPQFRPLFNSDSNRILVECKPSVGDDFPAVLRQMLSQRRMLKLETYHLSEGEVCQVLLVSQYHGVGASREQFVQFFEHNRIHVVFVADVEKELAVG